MKLMTELDLTGRRVLIREDLNVPLRDGTITNDARLRAAERDVIDLIRGCFLAAGGTLEALRVSVGARRRRACDERVRA